MSINHSALILRVRLNPLQSRFNSLAWWPFERQPLGHLFVVSGTALFLRFHLDSFTKAVLIGNMEQLTQTSDGSTSCLQYMHKEQGAHATSCPCALMHARHDWLPKLELVHLHLLSNWYDDRVMMLLFFISAASCFEGTPSGVALFFTRTNNDHNYIVQNNHFGNNTQNEVINYNVFF